MDRKVPFNVVVHGQLTSAHFPLESNICVKMVCSYGRDWKLLSGQSSTLTAFSYSGTTSFHSLDVPFEATFRSSNPHLWPRYVLTCYTRDRHGTDCVKGYGVLSLPTTPGRYKLKVRCFMPEPSSLIQRLTALIRGLNPELVNPLMPAYADGRYGLRVTTKGTVEVELSVQTKNTDPAYQFKPSSNIDKKATKPAPRKQAVVEEVEHVIADSDKP